MSIVNGSGCSHWKQTNVLSELKAGVPEMNTFQLKTHFKIPMSCSGHHHIGLLWMGSSITSQDIGSKREVPWKSRLGSNDHLWLWGEHPSNESAPFGCGVTRTGLGDGSWWKSIMPRSDKGCLYSRWMKPCSLVLQALTDTGEIFGRDSLHNIRASNLQGVGELIDLIGFLFLKYFPAPEQSLISNVGCSSSERALIVVAHLADWRKARSWLGYNGSWC